jgi:hypothetical protein
MALADLSDRWPEIGVEPQFFKQLGILESHLDFLEKLRNDPYFKKYLKGSPHDPLPP